MRNIVKMLFPCLALVLGMTSCYDTMDDKADVDKLYQQSVLPSVASVAAGEVTHNTAVINIAVSNPEAALEVGAIVASSSDFSDAEYIKADTVMSSNVVPLKKLSEVTNYFVKGYAFSRDGRIITSEASQFTTKAAPSFTIDGIYAAQEIDAETNKPGEVYDVKIAFAKGSTTEVLIQNVWGGGMIIKGKFDKASNTLTIANGQNIAAHPRYGDIFIASAIGAPVVTGKFQPKGGVLKTDVWAAACSAGVFGYQILILTHK